MLTQNKTSGLKTSVNERKIQGGRREEKQREEGRRVEGEEGREGRTEMIKPVPTTWKTRSPKKHIQLESS